MKKLLLLMLIAFVALGINAQTASPDVTLNESKVGKQDQTYFKYTGAAADTLTDNQDTVDVVFNVRVNELIKRVSFKLEFDPRTTADSVVKVSVLGEDFDDDAADNSVIASANSSAVAADATMMVIESAFTLSTAGATDTFNADSTTTVAARTVTENNVSWRKYIVRMIYPGDATGTGIEIKEIECKLHLD